MMMAAMPPALTLARSPLISHEMLPRSAGQARIAGRSAVDLGLVVATADGLDLRPDLPRRSMEAGSR